MSLDPPPGLSGLEAHHSWVSRPCRSDHRIVVLKQLAGTAGGVGGALVLASLGEEEVLDSDVYALPMERSVDGRLGAGASSGQILTGAGLPELGGVCQVPQELEESLLRPPDHFLQALRGARLLLDDRPQPSRRGVCGVGLLVLLSTRLRWGEAEAVAGLTGAGPPGAVTASSVSAQLGGVGWRGMWGCCSLWGGRPKGANCGSKYSG